MRVCVCMRAYVCVYIHMCVCVCVCIFQLPHREGLHNSLFHIHEDGLVVIESKFYIHLLSVHIQSLLMFHIHLLSITTSLCVCVCTYKSVCMYV